MAGQRPYSTNFLTSGKNAIGLTVSANVDTSKATNGTTVVNGKSIVVTNANGVITVTMPEKFAKCEWLDSQLVDTGKTGNQIVTTTDYNPANGTAVFSILSPTQTAVTTGTFKVYISAMFVS